MNDSKTPESIFVCMTFNCLSCLAMQIFGVLDRTAIVVEFFAEIVVAEVENLATVLIRVLDGAEN